jgi:hypothetical protein
MKRHNEKKETYRDEMNEVIKNGYGNKRDPEHLTYSAYHHWGNEKHSHIHKKISKEYEDYHKRIMGY